MSLMEFTAVEHFAHELAAPEHDAMPRDIEARTAAMDRAVSEVVAQYAPAPGMNDAQKAKNLKVVEGLVAMMSSHIDVLARNLERLEDPAVVALASQAHDDTVRQYYRLIALRADLDPECRPTSEVLGTVDELDAWFDRVIAS